MPVEGGAAAGDGGAAAGDSAAERATRVRFSANVDSVLYEHSPEPVMTDIGQQDSVGKRLYDKGIVMRQQRERREKSEELRKKGEERKAKKARPWVTEMAQGQARDNFTQFLHVQGKWENQKKFKLAQKSEERDKEDTGNMEVKRKWQMCPVSESIIDRKSTRGDYKGPQSGWKASFSKYIKSKNLEEVAEQDFEFEPTINISSKQIVRDVPTHERLHALAAEREESLLMLRAWEYDKSLIDPSTGAPRFHPKILNSPRAESHYDNARTRRRPGSVSPSRGDASGMSVTSSQFSRRRPFRELMDHLHEKREPSAQRATDVSTECTFMPQTNPTSTLILERSGYRPPLYQSTESLLEWREREYSRSPGRDPSGSRSVSQPPAYSNGTPHTQEREREHPADKQQKRERRASFMARQFRDQYEKKAKQKELRDELVNKELSQCTFRPKISKRSDELFRSSNYSQMSGPAPEPKFKYESVHRQRSTARESESETAAFIRQLEADHAKDREAGVRSRRAHSASPNPPAALSFSPSEDKRRRDDDEQFEPYEQVGLGGTVGERGDGFEDEASLGGGGEVAETRRHSGSGGSRGSGSGGGVPSPVHTPDAPSPFLNTLQNELKSVIDGWKDFDM